MSLIEHTVPSEQISQLTHIPTNEEIFKVMKSMPHNKSPGPDGFTSEFFHASWNIIGDLVTSAIKESFISKRLLKQLNATAITLIPKVQHPTSVTEFRPIACCNILYKCIFKLLANKLKLCLPDLIEKSQSAFICGRRIIDNVLLAHEIVKDYHKSQGLPRCA